MAARKIRPELAPGTVVQVRKAGRFEILGTETWQTAGGSRIYRGRSLEYDRVNSFSECDVTNILEA